MRTLFIAAASAIFFAAIVTELSTRLWPGNYFALLLLVAIVLFLSGLLNLRLARPSSTAAAGAARPRARARAAGGDGQGRDNRGRPRGETAKAPRREAAPQPPVPEGPRESGTVKWFNRTKGFGFVIRESGEEIFVHQRSIRAEGQGDERRRPALRDGQAVTFVVAEREKGKQAEDVAPAEEG